MKVFACLIVLVCWQAKTLGALPDSCQSVSATKNGIFKIQIKGEDAMSVYCDVELTGTPWLVIQRRKDNNINFYRSWSAYQRGFGELGGSFFIGLNKLNILTKSQTQELYIYLEDFDGQSRFAKYDEFAIGNEANLYGLNKLGNVSGNAGDGLRNHLNMKFTTYDRDNDNLDTGNCAVDYTGAWWYNNCHTSNLNGLYLSGENNQFGRGINWRQWREYYYSYKTVQMMIRPKHE